MGGRLIGSYAGWQRHKDPYWWSNATWRSKTPDWQEQIAREQRLHCPSENRKSMAAFVDWLYSDAPKNESSEPWGWCQPDVGNPYTWPGWEFHLRGLLPLIHSLAIAANCWLVDDLGMKPQQVKDAASAHYCAFKWRDLSRLREVEFPKRPIIGTSPKLRLADMAIAARRRNIPVGEQGVKAGDGVELLKLLMSVSSGCGGPHGRGLLFPFLTVLE